MPPRFFQSGGGLGWFHSRSQHHHRDGRPTAAGFESSAGLVVIRSGGLFQNSDGALDKFFVLGPDVHHEISVDIAQPSHGTGRDHVQDHFVRRTGFHAGRSGQDLRSHLGDDGEISSPFKG